MTGTLRYRTVPGPEAAPFLDDLGRLRIAVFREWPYLYDGDLDYERDYLSRYLANPHSLIVLALEGREVVGASTAQPLAEEAAEFREPFQAAGLDPARYFYFGESVLLPSYRGLGAGSRFMDERIAAATRHPGIEWCTFCAVDRDPADPRRPGDYRSLEEFWKRRGFRRHDTLAAEFSWKEIGHAGESPHRLSFWLRPLVDR